MDAFSSSSGLKINYVKSSLSPINLDPPEAAELASVFCCSIQDFPFTYLGLPLPPKPLRKSDYLPIIEKVDKRLAGWRAASLSRGGRLVLLNSVLSSIPSYFGSVFRFPIWVCNSIDWIRRGFFWNGKILRNEFHCLVRWNNVCRPKKVGGLGIRDLRSFNAALLMKGLRNFYHSQSLPWVRLLAQKHYKFRAPASCTRAPVGSCPLWTGILFTSSAFHSSISFSLVDGSLASFWNSCWNGLSTLKYLFSGIYESASCKHLSVRKWVARFAGSPNLGLEPPLAGQIQSEIGQLRSVVDNVLLSDGSDVVN